MSLLAAVDRFFKHDAFGGILLMASALAALMVANSSLQPFYDAFLGAKLSITLNGDGLAKPLILWINDGLMAIFFLLVGLELKREVLEGSLRDARRAALPALRRSASPAIAVTASVSGLGGDPGLWAYNAAKGGVINFVRSAALELGREGIRINAVCPGPIHTGMTGALRQSPAHEALRRHIPLGRWGEADEVASVLVFLCSPAASFVNGAVVPVDGGVSASSAQFTPWGDRIEP